MNDTVIIVEYNPIWSRLFEEEKARIVQSLGGTSVVVEHIGSTAVQGLAAKPIIDIMIGVTHFSEAKGCISPLQAIGYDYVQEFEKVMPERLFFRRGTASHRTHHIHLLEDRSDFWVRHVRFRDVLRKHPDLARRYEVLKKELALKFQSDRDAYADAKTQFIEEALKKGL